MPDFGTPVVDPKGFSAVDLYGKILGIKSAQQNLQIGQQTLAGGAADVQKKQQEMQERLGIQKMMQSGKDDQGNTIYGPDGKTPDPSRVLPAVGRIAPLIGQKYAQDIIETQKNNVGLQSSAAGLDMTHRQNLMGIVQSGALNPNEDSSSINSGIDNYVQQHPEAGQTAGFLKGLVSHLDNIPPQGRAEAVQKLASKMQPGQSVQTQPAAATVNTGKEQIQGTTAPPVAGGGFSPASSVKNQIPPGYNLITDSRTGNFFIQNQQNPNDVRPLGAGGGSGSGSNSNAPPNFDVGEADVVKTNTAKTTQNRQLAQDAQTQKDILGRIQSLASSPGLYIGPKSEGVAQLATAVSKIPGFEKAAQYANNYNELTKFMAQNAARQGAAMGLEGSDARLDLAMHSQPNASMDTRTIKNVSQYISGLVRMQQSKADAMDKWLQQPGNSLRNEHHFEEVWRDNADPRLFQLAEMKDQGEAKNYAKLHIRANERKDLQNKHQVMVQLGALPKDE